MTPPTQPPEAGAGNDAVVAGDPLDIDLLVVGAGPTGLYAAYYAGFRNMSVAIVDSLPEAGGQITAMYPEKVIYDVAGYPAIVGQRLVEALVDQAGQYSPHLLLGQRAETLVATDDSVTVTTDLGQVVTARAVLITAGMGVFAPRPLPTGVAFEGRGLRYFVPQLQELAGLDVLIVGGGDSAFDWAMSLEPLARSVTLVHRRERFGAHESSVETVLASSVRVLVPFEVSAIHGDGYVSGVELARKGGQESLTMDVQAIVAALGFTADLGPMSRWGLELERHHIVVDTRMRTSLPRVFAAGDVVEYDGKVPLISVGFGEAATAVNNAAGVISPGAKSFPGHSSASPNPHSPPAP
ncbi:MAG: NAD(P)/FAD-dependent oxidoreductase [Nocardioidaceae bacterium]